MYLSFQDSEVELVDKGLRDVEAKPHAIVKLRKWTVPATRKLISSHLSRTIPHLCYAADKTESGTSLLLDDDNFHISQPCHGNNVAFDP